MASLVQSQELPQVSSQQVAGEVIELVAGFVQV